MIFENLETVTLQAVKLRKELGNKTFNFGPFTHHFKWIEEFKLKFFIVMIVKVD